ncbi:type II secretion system protein GspG [Candidatus Calescamantes bacterium]|nr:type II secretion system protein GspG [Candidatus Calescamantes bacterium]
MRKRGFTILELLIVVGVVGILATVSIINLTGIKPEATRAKVMADLRSIESAVLTYEARHYSFPPASGWESYLQNDTPRLLNRIPEDPWSPTDAKYQYDLDTTTTPGTYLILSVGPDGSRTATVGNDVVSNVGDDVVVTNARQIQ